MTKLLLALLFCIFYVPGYFFLFKEIGKSDYSLPSVIFGSFFTLFGIFGHCVLLFEKQYSKFEKDRNRTKYVRLFFKIIGTLFALGFGLLIIIASLFSKPDKITQQDLRFITGTLQSKPKFSRGSKSSTSLYIYLNEFPKYAFEPTYNKFVHFQTMFEKESNSGDTIILGIIKSEYFKHISQTSELTYTDKHINSNIISTYYIEANKKAYYNTVVHNQLDKEDKELGRYLWIIGLAPLLAIISIWFSELTKYLEFKQSNKILSILLKLRKKKIL
ncbi:MAG TPA: hypothetical protein VLZ83_07785 [Edaphocola sp.]|nr:hypothetical protein [Edaphocola sp.]